MGYQIFGYIYLISDAFFKIIYLDRNLVRYLNLVSEFWKIWKEYNILADDLQIFALEKTNA